MRTAGGAWTILGDGDLVGLARVERQIAQEEPELSAGWSLLRAAGGKPLLSRTGADRARPRDRW